jgi:hypothetical protein
MNELLLAVGSGGGILGGLLFLVPFCLGAATKVSDVIQPEVWSPYMVERTAELSTLIDMGIVVPDAEIEALIQGGGRLIDMPFWTDLDGAEETLQDDTDLTPAAIDADQDTACKLFRGKAWGVNDLAKYLSGDDPAAAIADLAAAWWDRREQAVLINVLNGVFADNIANDSGDMVSDISIEDGDNATADNLISAVAVLNAAQTMGDAKDKLTAIAIHSVVENRMAQNDLIEVVRDSDGKILYRTFMGLRVIVNDNCPRTAGATSGYKYTTYLFGAGAIARADRNLDPGEAVETERNGLGGETYLIHRRHFIIHPRGVEWQDASVAATKPKSPSNAELAMAANWDRAYERKNVRLAKLVTNG